MHDALVKSARIPDCHPEREYKAKGLCGACYIRNLRASNEKSRLTHRAASKRWAKANPEKVKAYVRKSRYDLKSEEFLDMLDAQGRKCGICGLEKPLVIDHDHMTMRVRGLLCHSCNLALGLFEKLLNCGDVASYLGKETSFVAKINRSCGAWSKSIKPVQVLS